MVVQDSAYLRPRGQWYIYSVIQLHGLDQHSQQVEVAKDGGISSPRIKSNKFTLTAVQRHCWYCHAARISIVGAEDP